MDQNVNPLAMNPALEDAALIIQMGPGYFLPWQYTSVKNEILGYRESAWIGTTLNMSPIYDVYGPDARAFLQSVCVNDFSKLGMTGIRHAVLCNDKGQIITDGVVIMIGENHFRTYWLSPVLKYYVETSDMDIHGEDLSGQEYFIQVQGERSLEILEDAFEADLHDIKFAKHRLADMQGHEVQVIRLGMSGNLAYEIHGPIADYEYVYNRVVERSKAYGARQLGNNSYNLFNHTEAGFPNIGLHYLLPYFESSEGMTAWMWEHPMEASFSLNMRFGGSVGDDLQTRFMTPFDVGWGFLVKFNHEFPGRAALEEIAKNPPRTCVTLEWNAEDVGKVFATRFVPGEEPADDITPLADFGIVESMFMGGFEYRADKVLAEGKEIGISTGRIQSYAYNAMISLGFISPEYAQEGTELELIWGTPGTRQMPIRVKVARFPYNGDLVRNEDRDAGDIPHRYQTALDGIGR